MRIIAGTLRSRLLRAPSGAGTRPTSDRLRETLFNVLAPRVDGAAFLDLYAGSGAVGMEALSRGARSAEFVEQSTAATGVLRANLAQLGIGNHARIHPGSVANWLRRFAVGNHPGPASSAAKNSGGVFDLVFLDPPWDAVDEYEIALELLGGPARRLLAPGALVIAEHRRKQTLKEYYGVLQQTRLLEQGDAALSFFSPGLDSLGLDRQAAIPAVTSEASKKSIGKGISRIREM
jgi:16S rRNA (guanine(966)-N(2))-methyltransferase RsmD